jgi:hypothetical protein
MFASELAATQLIWQRKAQKAIELVSEQQKEQSKEAADFSAHPHKLLASLFKQHGARLGPDINLEDPKIEDTIALLETLQEDDETSHANIDRLLKKLKIAMDHYQWLIQRTGCLAIKERTFPGYTKNFFRSLTFSTAFNNELFRKHIKSSLEPKLRILLSTYRELKGLTTVAMPAEPEEEDENIVEDIRGQYDEDLKHALDMKQARVQKLVKGYKATSDQLNVVWMSLQSVLSVSADMKNAQLLNELQTAASIATSIRTRFSGVGQALQHIHPIVPSLPAHADVSKEVTNVLLDWATFLSTRPSHADIDDRVAALRMEMTEAVMEAQPRTGLQSSTGIDRSKSIALCSKSELDAIRTSWIDRELQDQWLPEAAQCIAETAARDGHILFMEGKKETISMYSTQSGLLDRFQGSLLSSALQRSDAIPSVFELEQAKHGKVWSQGSVLSKMAVKLDTAFYCLSLCASLDSTDHRDMLVFINAQAKQVQSGTGLSNSFLRASMAFTACRDRCREEGHKKLHSGYLAPMLELSKQFEDASTAVLVEIEKQRVKHMREHKAKTLAGVEKCHKQAEVLLKQLPDLPVDIDDKSTEPIRSLLAKAETLSTSKRTADTEDICVHVQSALTEARTLLSKTAKKLHLRSYSGLVSLCVSLNALCWLLS